MYRLGSDDLETAGVNIEDSKNFAIKLQEAEVDIIDVSGVFAVVDLLNSKADKDISFLKPEKSRKL